MRSLFRPFMAAAVLALCARAQAVDIVAGPMVGHVTDRSARVWMQFPIAGKVSLTAVDTARNIPVSGLQIDVVGPSPFILDVPLNNLEPDHSYRVTAEFEGKPLPLPGPAVVIRTAPPPGEEAPLSLAFGSDIYVPSGDPRRGPPAPIFKGIAELRPRAFFFLGNTGYLPAKVDDFPNARRPAFRLIADMHSAARQHPDLQPLLRTTPCYGIFNDRDFGVPSADRTFVYAPESLVAFQRFWPNPNWGTPLHPGCYTAVSFGDVDIFLLDTRTYRDPPAGAGPAAAAPSTAPAAPARLLGEAQMEWLQKGLKESRANFKIIAAPTLLFSDAAAPVDSWARYPEEQAAFLRWLTENGIGGLIALAGNQPAGQLSQFRVPLSGAAPGIRYPILTLGCSTLTDAPRDARPPRPPVPARAAELVQQNNFGSLTFTGQREKRFVTLRLHDEAGRVRIEQTVFAGQLRNP